MKSFKQYDTYSKEHAATVTRHIAPRGKASIAIVTALLMITLSSLGTSGCSRSKSSNQNTSANQKASTETISTQVSAPALIPAPATNQPQSPTKKSVRGPVRKLSSTLNYTDSSTGISFKYPRNARLAAGDNAELDRVAQERLPMNFVQAGGMTIVVVELPQGSETVPSSQLLVVRLNKQLNGNECGQFAAQHVVASKEPSSAELAEIPAFQTLVYKQTIQGVDYAEFQQTTKEGEAKYYHRFLAESGEKGACYEFGLAVGPTQENADNTDASVDSSAEHKNVFVRLEKILATVNIKSATIGEIGEGLRTASKLDESSQ